MARVTIEDFEPTRHPNHMSFVDNVQAQRRVHAGSLEPYKVCLVNVAGFTFIFHSTTQLALCLDFYRLKHLPSGRLPVHTGLYGGDQSETQRWFERLPGHLRAERTRDTVVAALEDALRKYSLTPGAVTGTPKPALFADGFPETMTNVRRPR
jgi:hypothetical protein